MSVMRVIGYMPVGGRCRPIFGIQGASAGLKTSIVQKQVFSTEDCRPQTSRSLLAVS
jgi:hypothetical protein